ncbi:MAG: acyltransferase [Myxococcales bacterium]|nr:acyltransferase [Myxococcales bacterium]
MNAPSQRIVRVALTETCNAYRPMPATIDGLGALADRLGEVRAANIAHNMDLVDRAADHGAQIVGLGELCSAPYFALVRDRMWLALAEDAAAGPTVSACRERARARGVCVVAPIFEDDPVSGRRFNTAVVIDERGEILGKYRKTHIPEGQNELGSFHESFYYGPSDGELGEMPGNVAQNPFFPVFETRFGRLGVAICYDRHFEGVVRSLAAGGAQIILSPAITFGAKSRRVWEQEFEVDAVRHRLYIAGSNRRGAEAPWNQDFFGGSYFAGPNGRVPTIAGAPAGLVIADLDLGALAGTDPSGWDLGRDRRPGIYSP